MSKKANNDNLLLIAQLGKSPIHICPSLCLNKAKEDGFPTLISARYPGIPALSFRLGARAMSQSLIQPSRSQSPTSGEPGSRSPIIEALTAAADRRVTRSVARSTTEPPSFLTLSGMKMQAARHQPLEFHRSPTVTAGRKLSVNELRGTCQGHGRPPRTNGGRKPKTSGYTGQRGPQKCFRCRNFSSQLGTSTTIPRCTAARPTICSIAGNQLVSTRTHGGTVAILRQC